MEVEKLKELLPISVVIPTMNRPSTLKQTIDQMLSNDMIPQQLIIVDQSQAEEDKMKNEQTVSAYLNILEVNYIHQEIPSLTKARNIGIEYCKNEIVVCSDDDIEVEKNTFENIFLKMKDSSIAMIAGIDKNMPAHTSKIGYLFGTKSLLKKDIGHITKSMLGRYPNNIIKDTETMWAMGYFFVVKKSLIYKWGLKWDENLQSYAYPEDLDFSYSYFKFSKKENLKCILTPEVTVKHLASQEYRIPSKKQTYMYVIHREYLSYKHNIGFLARLAVRWTNFGYLLMRLKNKENISDFVQAELYCLLNRKRIKKGNFKID